MQRGVEVEASFNPHAIERSLYREWEAAAYFAPRELGESYCIHIPPPNVTGSLHMGHAFQHTLMDALIRFQRMRGRGVLWQMGTDHAGISTQMLVERQLNAEGKTRAELGREKFIERVWQWKRASGGNISAQLRRMGSSLDWSRERFTLDEGYARAVIEAFVRLHEDGLIYRGQRLVNWDPALGTAISDLEVVNAEEEGSLWHMRYPLCDGGKTPAGEDHLVVATTRPETMLGDTAVAVHPEDERYRSLIGKRVRLPLVGRELPIIADSYVDPAFGSGCVKITPAHDFNDNALAARHGLPLINVLTEAAAINGNAPAAYRGLDRFAARQRIVDDLNALGLLAKVQGHRLMVPRGGPLRGHHRTPADPSMVRQDRVLGGTGCPSGAGRTYRVRPQGVWKHLLRLDAQHSGLVHQPPAVVGPPHSRMVRSGRRHLRWPGRGGRPPPRRAGCGPMLAAGGGRAGDLVLFLPVDLRHPRLARRDP